MYMLIKPCMQANMYITFQFCMHNIIHTYILACVRTYIHNFATVPQAADNMFEPLKETIELLRTYGQEMPDEVYTQLQVCKYMYIDNNYDMGECYHLCMRKCFLLHSQGSPQRIKASGSAMPYQKLISVRYAINSERCASCQNTIRQSSCFCI